MIAVRDRCDAVIFASPFMAATSGKQRLDHVRDHSDSLRAIPTPDGHTAPSLTMTNRVNYTNVVLSRFRPLAPVSATPEQRIHHNEQLSQRLRRQASLIRRRATVSPLDRKRHAAPVTGIADEHATTAAPFRVQDLQR